MKKAIFLDRDGTIIIDKHYLNDANQVEYIPGAIEALRLWQDAGYDLIVVTNQSGIAKGIISIENLNLIHEKIQQELLQQGVSILAYYYSPHASDSNHPMRKPNPGMLLQAAKDFDIDLKRSWMVGDKVSDVEAGRNAGCKTIFLQSDNSTAHVADLAGNDILNLAKLSLR